MNRTDIIKELEKRGYVAEKTENVKNGVIVKGIIIDNGIVSPVIYTDKIIEDALENGKDVSYVAEKVIDIFEKNRECGVDINSIFDKDFVLSHVYIGIQKESDEELEKGICDYEGLETYMYIKMLEDGETNASIKIRPGFLDSIGISRDEAWQSAESNTNAETEIMSMAQVLCGICPSDFIDESDPLNELYVISNKSRIKGASAILDHDALFNFAQEKGVSKLVVLPSSTHEMIILPYEETMDISLFSEMVREINENEVKPEERLTDRAYVIEV